MIRRIVFYKYYPMAENCVLPNPPQSVLLVDEAKIFRFVRNNQKAMIKTIKFGLKVLYYKHNKILLLLRLYSSSRAYYKSL